MKKVSDRQACFHSQNEAWDKHLGLQREKSFKEQKKAFDRNLESFAVMLAARSLLVVRKKGKVELVMANEQSRVSGPCNTRVVFTILLQRFLFGRAN